MKILPKVPGLSPPNLRENAAWSVGGGSGLEKGLVVPPEGGKGSLFS